MAKVKIEDILIPDVWDEYFLELTTEKSNLIDSGIVVPDPKLDVLAAGGGRLIDMPFFGDLTGDDQILDDTDPLTPGKIGTGKDIARLHLRGDARSVNDLSGALAGADPLAVIANRIHNFWMRKEQALLIATLTGIFASNAASNDSDLIHTHAAEETADVLAWSESTPTVMCPEAIADGIGLLGDSGDRFTAICMHSKCLTDLRKQELIDYEKPSGVSMLLPFYMGKRVIVDDNCPTRAGTGTTEASTVYQSFLFAEGAIGRGEGRAPVPSEFERDGLAGDTHFITRRHFILHPRGIKWTETSVAGQAPTNAECQAADNWTRVYEKKNLRIAMIETN